MPLLRDEQLTITNFTGHPSLTLRAGFVEVSRGAKRLGAESCESASEVQPALRVPHGITIVGWLFDDGLIGRVGVALSGAFKRCWRVTAGFECSRGGL